MVRWIALAVLVALLAGAAGGWLAARRSGAGEPVLAPGAAPPAGAPGDEAAELRRRLAEAEARIAELEAARAGGLPAAPAPETPGVAGDAALAVAERAAVRLARSVLAALQADRPYVLALLAADPIETELAVIHADGTEFAGTLEDPAAVGQLVEWVRARALPSAPEARYIPDRHGQPPDAYHNVILVLRDDYLWVQFDPEWSLVKLVAQPEEPELD